MSNKSSSIASSWQDMIDVIKGLNNRSNGAAGLAEGANAATIKTVNAISYCIDGLAYSKGATDNITLSAASGTVTQAVSTFNKYLACIDSNGAITIVKGDSASTAALALVPSCPGSKAPIGYFQVATDATHTFLAGTTDLSAAGITATFQDMCSIVDT